MTFVVFSLCPASSVLLSVVGKIKADSDSLYPIFNHCLEIIYEFDRLYDRI